MAFFPCIYFCENNQLAMSWSHSNYKTMTAKEKTDTILKRMSNRERFIGLIYKLATICVSRLIRMVIENPYNGATYLKQNFVKSPSIIDNNRMLRGDYFVKPTAYWFFNCEPTYGFTEQGDKEQRRVADRSLQSKRSGLCSEERSMISPDYARNFICDFLIGKEQPGTQLSMF